MIHYTINHKTFSIAAMHTNFMQEFLRNIYILQVIISYILIGINSGSIAQWYSIRLQIGRSLVQTRMLPQRGLMDIFEMLTELWIGNIIQFLKNSIKVLLQYLIYHMIHYTTNHKTFSIAAMHRNFMQEFLRNIYFLQVIISYILIAINSGTIGQW